MLRLAQFGLGSLGELELDLLAETGRVDVVAVADPADESRTAVADEYDAAAYAGYETLLDEHGDDLDAVNVVTPHALHFEQATAALEAGCAVHLEKPMVTDLDDAVALVETCEAVDPPLQVGYQRHHDPRFERVRALVAEGAIGDVGAVNYFLEQDWIRPVEGTWRSDPALSGGGQLYDSGSHLLDALLWVTDRRPARVAAMVDDAGHAVDVHSSLSVELGHGAETIPASVFVTGDGPTGPSTREGLFVFGSEGSVEYTDGGVTVRRRDGETESLDLPAPTFADLTEAKLTAFTDVAAGERPNPVPPETGLWVTALTEAAYRAAEAGETVDVGSLVAEAGGERGRGHGRSG